MLINKRTKVEQPTESETDFDYRPVITDQVDAKDSSVEEILTGTVINLVHPAGRITCNGVSETHLISRAGP